MKNNWDQKFAGRYKNDLLAQRVYSSRILGNEEDLVLHGGGNTSVKILETNIFGEKEEILYVKGSGWDLSTIEKEGFAPVRLDALKKLAQLDHLTDVDMVKYQRMAMTNPSAPNPSVEAILHGIIPFKFVDHTHADAVVTITNSPGGKSAIQEIYGEHMLIVPYVMPGFLLAKKIYEMTKEVDWDRLEGMILLSHGVFTFADDAKSSYDQMIKIVSKSEQYLKKKNAVHLKGAPPKKPDILRLAAIRKMVSVQFGKPVLSHLDNSKLSAAYSNLSNLKSISGRGPLTPDHIIRTKRTPVVFKGGDEKSLTAFAAQYERYFEKYNSGEQRLDCAPRWGLLPGYGALSFGISMKAVQIIKDISRHTQKAIVQAEQLGRWKALDQKSLFEMEYWSLEQAKLKKSKATKTFQGKVAIVTGAASGIGKACVEELLKQGACVAGFDIDQKILNLFSNNDNAIGICGDVTKEKDLNQLFEKVICHFGGLDMLISNAGIFPPSARLEKIEGAVWDRSININITSHQRLIKKSIPFLELGIGPGIVVVGSKNVPAPGPGAAAYSVAKAGLTQLARVAALELGGKGIRINTIHPNAVFDTGIWTDDVLSARAKNYGLSVAEYKKNNVLKKEVTSKDVAALTVSMLGPLFDKVTGAQIPIDGGNERVI